MTCTVGVKASSKARQGSARQINAKRPMQGSKVHEAGRGKAAIDVDEQAPVAKKQGLAIIDSCCD